MTDIFRTVLNMSITGAYISAAIIILRIAMKKLPKKYSYLLWAILGIRLLCPFSFSSAVSVFNVLVPEKPEVSYGQMEFIPNDIEYSEEPQIIVSVPPVNEKINEQLPPEQPNNSANPMQIAMAVGAYIWAAGTLAMLIYTVASYISVKKKVKNAALSDGNVYTCASIETPFVFGIIKPRIYLPENISEEDKAYIIAHEQAHISRKDHIVKLVAMAALCVHWFNPMVWVSYRLMTKDMELSCDEKALGTFDADVKKAYANALLNISLKQNRLALGGVLNFGESDIKSRIKGVLGAKKPKVIVTIIAVIAVIIAAVCLLTNAVKKDKEFEPIADGVYVTDKLLYTAPYKDSYRGDDNGLTYEIKDNTITISGKTYMLSEPMEIPFSEEEWSETFDNFEKIGWQDGEKNLGDYDNKYCYALQSDEDGGFENYLFVMDDELWYVTYGWEIYRLKHADNYTPSKAYTYISAVTDLENALKFERMDGDDPLCISIKVPNSSEEEEDFVRFSYNTVMYISPFAEIPIGTDAVDEAMIGAINDMEKSCVVTEHNGEIPCREYIIDDNGTVRWLCFVYENSDLNCGNIIKFVTTDESFTYEKAERIVSTAHFMLYADFSDTENFNQPTEDIPEDVSDDDVTDEPAYSLPANEAPPLQTSDEFESEEFGDFKKVSYKTKEFIPYENGGFSFSADRKILNIEFIVPNDWTYKNGDFENEYGFVMSQHVAYPDSYGIVTDDYKIDQVSGREVKIIDERYGGENDPWSYYIHTIIADSYYGDFDYHHFVVHSGEYYVQFSFKESEDFSMAAAEAILSTVTVAPFSSDKEDENTWTKQDITDMFYNMENSDKLKYIDSVVMPDRAFDRIGAVLFYTVNGAVEVAFFDEYGFAQRCFWSFHAKAADPPDLTYLGNGALSFKLETENHTIGCYTLTIDADGVEDIAVDELKNSDDFSSEKLKEFIKSGAKPNNSGIKIEELEEMTFSEPFVIPFYNAEENSFSFVPYVWSSAVFQDDKLTALAMFSYQSGQTVLNSLISLPSEFSDNISSGDKYSIFLVNADSTNGADNGELMYAVNLDGKSILLMDERYSKTSELKEEYPDFSVASEYNCIFCSMKKAVTAWDF